MNDIDARIAVEESLGNSILAILTAILLSVVLDRAVTADEVNGNPVVDASELTLLFAGRDGQVWSAHRPDLAHGFEIVGPVPELGAAGTARPTWVSRDGCTLYLESDRAGDFDVYVATRSN